MDLPRLLYRRLAGFRLVVYLPVLAGVAVFVCAVATTQVATSTLGRELDRTMERLGQVYLDGLSAAVLPALADGDTAALRDALNRALGFQEGVRERWLLVARPDTGVLAEAGTPIASNEVPPPFSHGDWGAAWVLAPGGEVAWTQRPVPADDGTLAVVAAKLDFSAFAARRRQLGLGLLAMDILLAAAGAALAALLARRILRPMAVVTGALDRAGAGRFDPIPAAAVPPPNTEAGRLADAFNLMADRLRERERLAERLAEQERVAVVGRLAATVAHEVRNPLSGMLTAVETARRFGADARTRDEALAIIERGLRQIEGVVASTLAVHRPEGGRGGMPRPITSADLDDLRMLVAPEASRRRIALAWEIHLQEPFPTDALRLRQAVLNLLLNAVAATPPGGRVGLEARIVGGELEVAVVDTAGTLPAAAAARLMGGGAAAGKEGYGGVDDGRIGLDVVMRLVGRLSARVAVESEPGQGTRITLVVPPPGPREAAA